MEITGSRMLRTAARVGGVLLGIQAVRAAVFFALVRCFAAGTATFPFQMANGASIAITGALVLLVARPSWAGLGWSLRGASPRRRLLSLLGLALVAVLVGTSAAFGLETLTMNVTFGLLVPAFEETIFRGWVHERFADDAGLGGWRLVGAGAVVFGLWHLGYADVLVQHPLHAPVLQLLVFKVAYGTLIGAVFGWLRLKTGGVHASFVAHAVNNIFAP